MVVVFGVWGRERERESWGWGWGWWSWFSLVLSLFTWLGWLGWLFDLCVVRSELVGWSLLVVSVGVLDDVVDLVWL